MTRQAAIEQLALLHCELIAMLGLWNFYDATQGPSCVDALLAREAYQGLFRERDTLCREYHLDQELMDLRAENCRAALATRCTSWVGPNSPTEVMT